MKAKDYYAKINWMRVLLAIVTAIALIIGYYLVFGNKNGELWQSVIADLVAVLIAIPIVYFVFTIRGISPQQELIDDLSVRINRLISEREDILVKHTSLQLTRNRLMQAKSIDWIGISMYKTLSNIQSELQECLTNNCKIRILLIDPNSRVPEIMAKKGYALSNPKNIIQGINSAIEFVDNLKKQIPNSNIEIRFLDGHPPYRLTIIDRALPEGYLRLRLFSYPKTGEMAALALNSKKHNDWYSFFVGQFEKHWENSIIRKEESTAANKI